MPLSCDPTSTRHFAPSVVAALADVVTGGSGTKPDAGVGVYRSATALARFFAACDLEFSLAGGSRVPAALDLLGRLNRDPEGLHQLVRVIETALDPREYYCLPERHAVDLAHIGAMLHPDAWELHEQDGLPRLQRLSTSGAAAALRVHADTLDLDTVRRDLDRALAQADRDPEAALTAACSCLESVCRSILARLGAPLPSDLAIVPLAKATRKALELETPRNGLPADVATAVQQVLGNLQGIAGAVGALRTSAGNPHGRPPGYPRVDAHIARLGINAATTIALFLIETWWQRARKEAGKARGEAI